MTDPCLPPVGTIERRINKSLHPFRAVGWGPTGVKALHLRLSAREIPTFPSALRKHNLSLQSRFKYSLQEKLIEMEIHPPLKPLSLSLAGPLSPVPPPPHPLLHLTGWRKEKVSMLHSLPGFLGGVSPPVSSSFCITLKTLTEPALMSGQVWFVLCETTQRCFYQRKKKKSKSSVFSF